MNDRLYERTDFNQSTGAASAKDQTVCASDRDAFSSAAQIGCCENPGKTAFEVRDLCGGKLRAVCRARSKAEFIARMGVVIEEADETVFWLEFLIEAEVVPKSKLDALLAETNELVRIFSASRQTAQKRRSKNVTSKRNDAAVQSLNRPITKSLNVG